MEFELAGHKLMINLKRVGLSTSVADQVISEVEDSVWLAMLLERAEREGATAALNSLRVDASVPDPFLQR